MNSPHGKRPIFNTVMILAIAALGVIAMVSVPLAFLHREQWALLAAACTIAILLLRFLANKNPSSNS